MKDYVLDVTTTIYSNHVHIIQIAIAVLSFKGI